MPAVNRRICGAHAELPIVVSQSQPQVCRSMDCPKLWMQSVRARVASTQAVCSGEAPFLRRINMCRYGARMLGSANHCAVRSESKLGTQKWLSSKPARFLQVLPRFSKR